MKKRSLASLEADHLAGQRVVVRVDFNVPLTDGKVADDTRIVAALPTIEYLSRNGARVVLLSHLGRPGGKADQKYSLRPVVHELELLLGCPVTFIADPASADAVVASRHLPRGGVALAENTRFHPGEERNDPELAARFAQLGDIYVNDAFGTAHRAHASTEAIAHLIKPAVAGFLLQRELDVLGKAISDPAPPFRAILGGAKVSGKIDLIESLLPRVDRLLVGGAMACTFFKAMGLEVGNSLVEDDRLDMARELIDRAGDKLMLPRGAVIAERLESGVTTREVARDQIPRGWAMFDIDQRSVAEFAESIRGSGTVIWNGPMGVFEQPPFDRGTLGVAGAMAEATASGTFTIVGGGDSAAAIASANLQDRISHLSTGGGAALEFLEGKPLPGVAALDDAS